VNLPPELRLELLAPETPVPVLADPERLEQVLDALLENAVRYSPAGGAIAVAVEARAGGGRIAISDPGIGIAAADHERIFGKFERVDPQLGSGIAGNGLGLYIARDLVERMAGRISVESAPGRGSTFAFELPAPPERIALEQPAPVLPTRA
jgi:signal transduction histidine kinase